MTLLQKLNPKTGAVAVINSPKDILGEFKSLKPSASIPAGAKARFDFVLLFATNSKELEPAWKRIIPALKDDAMFWVAYPKKSSSIASDLGGMGGNAGSPRPVGGLSDLTKFTWISRGACVRRSGGYWWKLLCEARPFSMVIS